MWLGRPVATIIQDVLSLLIYFAIATLIVKLSVRRPTVWDGKS